MRLRNRIALSGTGILAILLLAQAVLLNGRGVSGVTGILIFLWITGSIFLWGAGGWIETAIRRSARDLAARAGREVDTGSVLAEETAPELREIEAALGRFRGASRVQLAAVERERDGLQALVDSIAEGVITLTREARILHMNAAAAQLLEVASPSPLAPAGTFVRNPELRGFLEASVKEAASQRREFRIGERYLLVSAYPMKGGGSVVTLLDVTGLRHMEQVRRDFVANASHELKTPLTAMRGFAETLLDNDAPEELRQRFLQSIVSNTIRLQHLVDDLLDLSRLESGKWVAAEEEVEIEDAARAAWQEIMAEHPERRTNFSVTGEAVAVADGKALHQIFRNLFDNALRYTPDEGRIEVRIRTEEGRYGAAPADVASGGASGGDGVEVGGSGGSSRTAPAVEIPPLIHIAVADSGAGIPSTALPRIFERFYRVDPGRDRALGGTGLGLSIVRHLVQSMKGEIRAESELGKGTVIHFTLPGV